MSAAKKFRAISINLEKKKYFVVFAFIFKVILEFAYINFINPVFAYDGFVVDVDPVKYIESWIIFILCIHFFPKKLNKPSDYLLSYILFSFAIPLLVYYGLADADRYHLFLVFLCISLVIFFRNGKFLKIPTLQNGRKLAIAMLLLGALMATAWMIYVGGLNYFNVDLARVYEYREGSGELINQGVMGYVVTWATKVFGPVLIAMLLWQRRLIFASVIIFLHFIWFAISSHKAVLFYPFLVTFLWIWFRHSKALSLVPLAMSIALVISLGVFFAFDEIFVGSLFIRRLFFVPAHLTFAYYEFFSNNPLVYWSNGIGSVFLDYPYELNTAKLIGDYLGSETSANNSFFSTGYMHAGIFGVMLYGILVGYLLRLIDSICHMHVPSWLGVAAVIVPAQALIISSDLPTVLLTHGMGIAIVFLFLLRKRNEKQGSI